MSKNPPRLAIFDLGNVVFRIDWASMFACWSKCSGVDAQILEQKFTFNETYCAFERGEISNLDFGNAVNKFLGMNLTYEEFREGWNAIYGEVIPEVQSTLEELQGKIRLIAYTNTNPIHNEIWPVRYKEVLNNFERIFVSSEIGFRKPDIEGYEHVLNFCSLKPEDVIFFDDREENIEGARLAGIESYLVDSDLSVEAVFRKYGLY